MLLHACRGLPAAVLVVVCAAPCPASAVGAGEKQVAGSVGWDMAGSGETARSGLQASVEIGLGLSDSWAGRGGVSMAWQPGHAGGLSQVTTIQLGMTYSLDVVRWVPFVELGISLADLRGDGASSQRLGPQVEAGIEYLLSRRWTLAAFGRFDYLALGLSGSAGHPWLVASGLRLGWLF
jgi:hypothetical protein